MAVDFFLKIDGIKGESRDAKHAGQIEIESFSWGLSNPGSAGVGGGGAAGKVSMQDFHFVTPVSTASPQLMLGCATGKHLKQAILTVRKAGGKQEDYLTVKMTDILVSSFQQGGAGGDVQPMDQVSLNFSKVELQVVGEDAAGRVVQSFEVAPRR